MDIDAEARNNGYSDAHRAEKDRYVDLATALADRGEYDEARKILCHLRDNLSSGYRKAEVDGLFVMCDFHLSQQEDEELRDTVECVQRDMAEKNYLRAKESLKMYKKYHPGEACEAVDRLYDLCETVLCTPPDRPYLEVLDLDSLDDDGTTAVIARVVKGTLSVADGLIHHGTGRAYRPESFRTVENLRDYDRNAGNLRACRNSVDGETGPFVFFVTDEYFEIEPGDWFFRG